jgi:hypothetical protein
LAPERFHALELGGHRVVLDTEVGHLRELTLTAAGRVIRPLHTAPWTSDAPIDRTSALPPTEQALSGDFLCAPFCANDVEGGPLHGATANGPWRIVDTSAADASLVAELTPKVMGATVRKTLRFRPGEPFLYIADAFTGGTGRVPVSHHAMIHVTTRSRLNYSPKALFFTGERQPEPGRSLLAYPSRGEDISAVPLGAGGTVDIRTYPWAERHEDIVAMMEKPGDVLGWSAAVRDDEDDIVLLLKDARVLPQTMLWMSNGGRDFPPWSGRHRHVLGIEDGCSFGPNGHRASIAPNAMSALGYPTAIRLEEDPEIRYAIGALPRPRGWAEVRSIRLERGAIILTDVSGETLRVPLAADWLLNRAPL